MCLYSIVYYWQSWLNNVPWTGYGIVAYGLYVAGIGGGMYVGYGVALVLCGIGIPPWNWSGYGNCDRESVFEWGWGWPINIKLCIKRIEMNNAVNKDEKENIIRSYKFTSVMRRNARGHSRSCMS